MIVVPDVNGKNVAVMGLGKSGIASALSLLPTVTEA